MEVLRLGAKNFYQIRKISQMANFREKLQLPNRYKEPDPSLDDYLKWTQKSLPLDMINSSQDFEGHMLLRRALVEAASKREYLQNPSADGQESLLEALALFYLKYAHQDLDPLKNILITDGWTRALYIAIMGFIQEGDEVILVEPYKVEYERIVREAGGTCRYIPLRWKGALEKPCQLKFDQSELAMTFNECTKMIIINNPQFPLGRFFTCEDFKLIANLCEIHNCICISDESSECLIYDQNKMERISRFCDPFMWERTITISSSISDVFNIPGINIAWLYGPDYLIERAKFIHSLLGGGGNIPIQEALAKTLGKEFEERILCAECGYIQSNNKLMTGKRELMRKILKNNGFRPILPGAGYHMVGDWTPMSRRVDFRNFYDYNYSFRYGKWLATNVGIQGIPMTACYGEDDRSLVENFIIFNFSQFPAWTKRNVVEKVIRPKTKSALHRIHRPKVNYPVPRRYLDNLYDQCFWEEFQTYACNNGAVNLGEEVQWCHGCEYTRKQLAKIGNTTDYTLVQYTRSPGHLRLAKAVAAFYDRYLEPNLSQPETMKKIDPMSEILITSGVQEAIYCAIMGIIEKGNEVVIIEPFKNTYVQIAKEAGGIVKYIPIKPKKDLSKCENWKLDEVWLGQIVSSKTKMIIINTPQFPLGKIWGRCELEVIQHYCEKWNIMCLCDESRDYLAHDPFLHVHMCTVKGMWERTLTIWSISDLFGLPGWNVACLYGPDYFIKRAQLVHQDLVYTLPTQPQEALAAGLEREINNQCTDCTFFASLVRGLEPRRQMLYDALANSGFCPVLPQAGYWMMVNWKPVAQRCSLYDYCDNYQDFKFMKWLSDNLKFQGIPCSPFYSDQYVHFGENYVAFCFLNDMKKLLHAKKMLKNFKAPLI